MDIDVSNKYIYIYSLDCDSCNNQNTVYIGVTSFPHRRLKEHKKFSRRRNDEKSNWINNNIISLNIIDYVEISNWEFWEQFYISLYKLWGFKLLNKTIGGKGSIGHKMPEMAKQKISEFQKGKQWNLGTKRSMDSVEKMKNNEGYKNRDWTSAVKKAQNARIGSKHSDESKLKMSIVKKGKKMSQSMKDKTSKRMKGKKLGEDWSRNIGRGHWVSILQFDKNGNFIKEWDCITHAAKSLKIHISSISQCLSGKYKTSGGFVWKHKN